MSTSLFDQSDHLDTAQEGVRNLLLRVVTAEHGADAVAERPISPRYPSTAPTPVDPRHGIAAARLIRNTATGLVRRQATTARGRGLSWAEIGTALGLDAVDGVSIAEAAFEEIAGAPAQRFDRVSVAWTCTSCGYTVADYGPYNNPADDQEGHDEDCDRLATELQAHRDWIND